MKSNYLSSVFSPLAKKSFFMILMLVVTTLFSFCGKDPNPFPQKYATYMLLCPNGTGSCYSDCAASTGYLSGGQVQVDNEPQYRACTGRCDTVCNTSFYLLLLQK